MSDHPGTACRTCGNTIYFHRSKTGKSYPTDSPTDRRDFHKCVPRVVTQPAPQQLEATTKERIEALELSVAQLRRMLLEMQQKVPIGAEDIPF